MNKPGLAPAALVVLLATGCGAPEPPDTRPDIVIVSIDALRADHLGCYGCERNTSPVIDSLAAAGSRFTACQSQAPWTLPSHASLFTGLDAVSHGAGYSYGSLRGLDRDLLTIAEILSESGYHTGAIVNISLLGPDLGFDQGFDTFQSVPEDGALNARKTVTWANGFIDLAVQEPEPFFLFVHLWDAHSPYEPLAPYDTLFTSEPAPEGGYWRLKPDGSVVERDCETLLALYDSEIVYTDEHLGRLFGHLRELGIAESTLVVVLSDHGEEFLDHGGTGHGSTLFQEVLHVPLVVSGPGVPVGVVDAPVGLYDLYPTLLACVGIPAPAGLPGIDVLGATDPRGRAIPSSGSEGMSDRSRTQMIAVRRGDDKVIVDIVTGLALMFDLASDPVEQSPRGSADEGLVAEALDVWAAPPAGPPDVVADQHRLEQIRSLGYLN